MTAFANESKCGVKFLGNPACLGLLAVAIGGSGSPTVVGPCAGITVSRASAGAYDFSLPTTVSGTTVLVVPIPALTSTIVGYQVNTSPATPPATRILMLKENAGTIAVDDPGNGDVLFFLVLVVGPNVSLV